MKAIKKEIVLCREDEGEVLSYPTLWDAYEGFKEVRRVDKEEKMGIAANEYYWIFRAEFEDGSSTEQDLKFYVRNNKMYYKMLGNVTSYERI